MKKVLIATMLFASLTTAAQGEFSAEANAYKSRYQKEVAKTRAAGDVVPMAGPFVITCKMSASPEAVGAELEKLGANVSGTFGRCLIVTIPADQLDAMAKTEGVLLIDVGTKGRAKTDVTRRATQAEEVQTGKGEKLPQAYTGKGVIVGLIDEGFDFTHPMFKDKDGNLRIKAAYLGGNKHAKSETVTVGGKTLSGAIITDPKVLLDTTQVKDLNGSHGTHCAAIAAGSKMDDIKGLTGNPLGGMAPEADLILCVDQYVKEDGKADDNPDPSIVYEDCYLKFMKHYAEKENKPLVVSWSVNSHNGFHNGTSTMAQMIGSWCKEGNAMMLCSSNEGGDSMYVHRTIPAGESANFAINVYPGKLNGYYFLKTTKPVKVSVGIYDIENKKEVYVFPYTIDTGKQKSDTISLYAGEAALAYVPAQYHPTYKDLAKYLSAAWCYAMVGEGSALESATSDKTFRYTKVTLGGDFVSVKDSYENRLYGLTLHITTEEATEMFSWIEDMDYYKEGIFESGTASLSMGDWNTSGEPVSVGAWCANITKKNFDTGKSRENQIEKLDHIASFSSYGTDLAGHKHPEACTPGVDVYSAINSFAPNIEVSHTKAYSGQFEGQKEARNYLWGIAGGTSMSTPASAGIVALWMQAAMDKDKTKRLTCADIKDIISHAVDTDDFTKARPDRFGKGKINAYKGLLYVLGLDTGIQGLSKDQPADVTFRVNGGLLYTEGAEDGTPVTLYNLSGAIVGQTTVQNGTVSLAGLPKGVYAVQLGKLGSTLIRL